MVSISAPKFFVESQSFFKIQQYFKKPVCDGIDATKLGNRTIANSAGDPFSIKYCSISIFITDLKNAVEFPFKLIPSGK